MNMGIDFGSTYSSFATYDRSSHLVELCKPTHSESEAVPSVACLDENDSLITGHEARAQIIEDSDTVSFDAFKMLLTEENQNILQQRGYDSRYTPRAVAQCFLTQQVKKIMTSRNEETLDRLVVCVPEVWTTKEAARRGMLDGRNVIMDICRRISDDAEVQVVSEPAAASACFVSHCQALGKQIAGYVLVVDYGGGTLDLTLTQVNPGEGDKNAVEIEVKNRTGVGENHPGKIGDAGIAYIEEVIRLALFESEAVPEISDGEALDPKKPEFRKAFNNLERKLKGQASRANGTSGEKNDIYILYDAVQDSIDDISRLAERNDCFTIVKFGKKKVVITFSQLIRAYDKIIRDRLDECLNSIREYMDYAGIDYGSSYNDKFHVILVGGFGKFILVQNQVEEFFGKSATGDKRFEYDLGKNREYAVAIGAALLADRIITIRQTAPYSIGIISHDASGHEIKNYAIRYRQEIKAAASYWIQSGGAPKPFAKGGLLNMFLIGYDIKGEQNHKMVLKQDLVRKIETAFERLSADYAAKYPEFSDLGLEFNMGFKMNDSEIVTLLLRAVRTGKIESIPLSNYHEMFELTEV